MTFSSSLGGATSAILSRRLSMRGIAVPTRQALPALPDGLFLRGVMPLDQLKKHAQALDTENSASQAAATRQRSRKQTLLKAKAWLASGLGVISLLGYFGAMLQPELPFTVFAAMLGFSPFVGAFGIFALPFLFDALMDDANAVASDAAVLDAPLTHEQIDARNELLHQESMLTGRMLMDPSNRPLCGVDYWLARKSLSAALDVKYDEACSAFSERWASAV